MKTKITMAIVVLIAMAGFASAEGIGGGCPSRQSLGSHTQTYDNLFADKLANGNVVTYLLNTVAQDGASVIGYCIYPTPGFAGNNGDLASLYSGWAVSYHDSKDYFGFQRGQGSNNIPIDGTTDIEIGKADYLAAEKVPTSEVILFHINDPEECGTEDTCWRRPGTSTPPVPELGTVVLMSAGILGLFLVARKYRKK